jgi:hypothetical protein
MKNTIFLFVAFLFLSVAASAQSTTDSIRSKYKLMPMPEPLTIEKTFPVLGSYQLNDAENPTSVVVALDSVSKGIVWVDGLPEGKFKAYLKQSPATYRIISQKTSAGKQIPEGTLLFDPSTGALHIALGKAFDEADPAAVFAAGLPDGTTEVKVKTKTSKSKSKVTVYTANKVLATTEANAASSTGEAEIVDEQ